MNLAIEMMGWKIENEKGAAAKEMQGKLYRLCINAFGNREQEYK